MSGKEVIVKYVIHNQVVLARAPEGPLAAYLVAFANALGAQGYSVERLKVQVRIASLL